ncbi:hypothetical protein BV898_19520 [Hypsibius exemplaris]|uniref:Uncharacterized protein n=1 Tax=Hypsibius exemplaris TaxID=2072580 RepID=A0A9X6NLU8_HYPEX|nr:hypothetical protein BV898_19520 [Hypsibius exemplaris]
MFHDLLVLRQILAMNPFCPDSINREGRIIWKKISEELHSEGVLATEREMRQRAIKQMDMREKREKKTLRTGEEEMYGEFEQLLGDLIILRKEELEILAEEAKAESSPASLKAKGGKKSVAAADAERVAGLEIRNASLATMEAGREEYAGLVEDGAAPSRTLSSGKNKKRQKNGTEPKRLRTLTAADKIYAVVTQLSDADNDRLKARDEAEMELKQNAQRQEDRRLDLQQTAFAKNSSVVVEAFNWTIKMPNHSVRIHDGLEFDFMVSLMSAVCNFLVLAWSTSSQHRPVNEADAIRKGSTFCSNRLCKRA